MLNLVAPRRTRATRLKLPIASWLIFEQRVRQFGGGVTSDVEYERGFVRGAGGAVTGAGAGG